LVLGIVLAITVEAFAQGGFLFRAENGALRAPSTQEEHVQTVREQYGIEISERPLQISDNYSLPPGRWFWDEETQTPCMVARFSPFIRFEQSGISFLSPGDYRTRSLAKYSVIASGHHYFLNNPHALPYVPIRAARDDESLLQENAIVRKHELSPYSGDVTTYGIVHKAPLTYGVIRRVGGRYEIRWLDSRETYETIPSQEIFSRNYDIMLPLGDPRAVPVTDATPLPPPGRITTVFIDVGGVILSCDYHRAAQDLARYSDLSEDEIFDKLTSPWLMTPFETGQITPERYFEIARDELHLAGIDYDLFVNIFTNIYTLRPSVQSLMRELRDAGYRIIIVSNTNALHKEHILRTYGDTFAAADGFIASNEVGAMKPDARIFEAALAHAGAEPHNVVFIDDVVGYTGAAERLGMTAVLNVSTIPLRRQMFNVLSQAESGPANPQERASRSALRVPAQGPRTESRARPAVALYTDEKGRTRIRWDSIPESTGKEKLADIRRKYPRSIYVVGGWIRDALLLGRESSDMDLALSSRSAYVSIDTQGTVNVATQAYWDILGMSPWGDSDAGMMVYTQPYYKDLAVDLIAPVVGAGGLLYPLYADFSFNFISIGFLSTDDQDPVLYDPYGGMQDLFPAQGKRRSRIINAHLIMPRDITRIARFTADPALDLGPIPEDTREIIDNLVWSWHAHANSGQKIWMSDKEGFVPIGVVFARYEEWRAGQRNDAADASAAVAQDDAAVSS